MELFRKSNREMKQTILIITHDENIAEQCDRILVLKDGKIIADEAQAAPSDDRDEGDEQDAL